MQFGARPDAAATVSARSRHKPGNIPDRKAVGKSTPGQRAEARICGNQAAGDAFAVLRRRSIPSGEGTMGQPVIKA